MTNDLKFNNDLTTVANGSLKNYIVADNWRLFAQGSGSDGYLQTQSTGGVDWTITSYTELVTDYTNQAIKLKNAGARYILVEMEVFSAPTSDQDVISSLYDTSSAMSNAFIISDTGYANITTYNKAVLSSMKAEGVNAIPFDDYSTTMHVIRNYADYGFSAYGMSHVACDAEVATLTGGWTSANCGTAVHGAVFSSDDEAYSAALNEFFFADISHKAPAFLRIEADVKYNLIAAPVQVGMLSESLMQSRRSFHQNLQDQITKSAAKQRVGKEKLNYWIDTSAANQDYDVHRTGFADIESREFAGTLGADYAIDDGNLIIGSSFSFFNRQIDYSDNRGSYKQDEYILSLYSAFTKDNFWSNAAASYGYIDNEIRRKSPLGITTQSTKGDTNSKNFSAHISTGYNIEHKFSDFSVNHGPIAGLTYQKIYQDGFTETSDVAVLALSFKDYDISSFEGEVGYQIQADVGIFQPFAMASIRHEFDDVENKITAAITSSTDYNQNYNIYMPVKNVNYGNYKVGSNLKFNDNFYANVYYESAYSESEKIYQNLLANLNYSF
ncbi:MAG: autotransporter domain-containing protein [Proteobacteria bacterium]|nr:autotransporter domain-containing protein [Pseudomonadota bacterium]